MFDRESVGLIAYFMRKYPARSALIILLLLLSGLAEGFGVMTLLPLLEIAIGGGSGDSRLGQAIGAAFSTVGAEPTVGALLIVIVLGIALKGALLLLAMKQVGYTVAHVATNLRLRLIRALLHARWSYYVDQPAGHVANAIGSEAHRASGAYREACSALASAIQVVVYGGVAFLVSWKIAGLGMIASVVLAYLLSGFIGLSRSAGRQQTQLMKSLSERLTDLLQGIKPIKAMAQEAHFWPILASETEGLNRAQERQVLAAEALRAVQEPMLVAMLAVGLYAAITWGNEPFTSLLVIALIFYRMVTRLHNVQTHYQTMATGESAFWSLHRSIKLAEGAKETVAGPLPPRLERSIRLEDVRFAHGEKPVLKGITLEVSVGEFVAIVGPSGAGKTTIADLIVGLYRPTSGEIYIDDVPLPEVDLASWRRMIGYVPQELLLFHDSILRNITLGDESIGRAEVEEALRDAGAWDFIAALPDGVDTVIGERGAKLSGGQRQRIAIARALVRKPKLLVLDEVTTALDPATEAAICQTLRSLSRKSTIISISHQQAMREVADVVYELSDGVLREVTSESRASLVGPASD